MVFYCTDNALPGGFTTTSRIKQFLSLQDAETAGILATYADETRATGTYLVTTAGTNGDVVKISVNEPGGNVVIGTYTKVSGDSTATLVATAIAAAINADTQTHGYSATSSSATVTITARKGLGIYLNSSAKLVVTLSSGATLAGTITQFSGGVASKQAVWHYQIKEFFRKQNASNGTDGLYVGFFTTPGSYDFSEITTMQTFAQGKIRQIGIYKDGTYASGDLTLIDGICKANDALKKNIFALYCGDLSGTSDISTMADLSLLSANKASSIIAQDGAALGNYLFVTTGKSVPALGAALGALSLSAVSEDFGQPIDKFNMSAGGGQELDMPAFANGVLINDASVSDALLNSLDAKRHIFLQKYIGYAGSYFNDNHASIVTSSDYAFINDNRVIDKAIRGIYIAVLPKLKGRLRLNSDGTLADTTVATFQNAALQPLFQMERDGDLSEVVPEDVYINPAQNVKQTNTIYINVSLNENGVARQIIIPIGFKSN